MFKVILFLLSLFYTLHADINTTQLSQLNVDALIVKKLSSGELLYAKESHRRVRPASLTKIMTALLAIEENRLERPVLISSEMLQVEPTKAGYKENELVLLDDLVKAAMIESDNDAAMAIAIAVGGSVSNFVAMMNEKAQSLGMENTHFTNPCGFDINDHYSTPSDLLKLAEYAIQNHTFNDISRQNKHTYTMMNTSRPLVAKTHNHLLGRYAHAVGIKTGYTSKAGPCFIARAKKDGVDCLIVMLNSKENRWKIAEQIFEQVFVPSIPKNTTLLSLNP